MATAVSPSPAAVSRADSDVDVLRRVLVHRPGSELGAVDAASAHALLFDRPVDLPAAQREHDELVAALGSVGAEVEDVESLLARALGSDEQARALIGGVEGGPPPLPNLLYPRDVIAVLGDGVHVARMALAPRQAEAAVALAAARGDAQLDGARCWSAGTVGVEGGDVLLAGDGVLVIGIGPRSSRAEARVLARRLLEGGAAREVIAAVMPPDGPFHLDLALTMVDRDAVLLDAHVIGRTAAIRWRAQDSPVGHRGLVDAIGAALGRELRVIEACEDPARERAWDRGANVVALRPGTVVAYADNCATNRRLERAGIEVLPTPGEQLGRGRGGPRCLTCPVLRG